VPDVATPFVFSAGIITRYEALEEIVWVKTMLHTSANKLNLFLEGCRFNFGQSFTFFLNVAKSIYISIGVVKLTKLWVKLERIMVSIRECYLKTKICIICYYSYYDKS
jgi:hypothetical protein